MASAGSPDPGPLKSILKKSTKSTTTPSQPAVLSPDDRDREIAFHHARIIQLRKEIDRIILTSTENLLDLPFDPTSDPAHPSPAEAYLVRQLLTPFQLSDYDHMIKERNIDGKCGYMLCPRPHSQENTNAKFRIIHGKGKGAGALKVVQTQKLEQWCSEECAERAMYVRVQLSEVPAWIRDSDGEEIELLSEKGGAPDGTVSTSWELESDSEKGATADDILTALKDVYRPGIVLTRDGGSAALKDLALERGETKAPGQISGLGDLEVMENFTIDWKFPERPDFTDAFKDWPHPIEGYTPQTSGSRMPRRHQEDEQEESNDNNDIMRTI
ncbi:hypothetical protein MMC08_004385 [Hypocenomyce scalaris]|nr:hypothetical protein [Hypocenomyce scalaris]